VLGVLVVGTACGSGSGSGGSGGAQQNVATLIAATPDKTTAAGTARFTLTAATQVLGQAINFTGSGVFNFSDRSGHVNFRLPQSLGGTAIDEIVTKSTIYLQIPQLIPNGKYAAIDLTKLGGGQNPLSQLGNADPSAALEMLRGVSQDVHKVGTATVRGTNTTHYKGTIDIAAATQKVPAFLRGKVRTTFGQLKTLPFDAYIDDQGRLNRLVQTFTIPASTSTGGKPVTVTSSFDMYDFGIPVHVTAPASSRTVDGSALLSQLLRRG
jgi:hypothetical protein